MKKIIYCAFLFLIVATWFGCGKNHQFRHRLEELDAILISHPDSVYYILQGMESEAQQQSYSDYMYYELLRADAQNKAYIDFTTDSVMAEVVDYYERNGTPNEKMRANYLLGCTYRDLKDIPMEMQCFLTATEKADTSATDCDLYTLYAVYGQMADIYSNQNLPLEELKTLAICEKIALKDNDTLSAIKAYELRLCSYSYLNNPDSVLAISEKARKRYLAINAKKEAAMLLNPAISILLDREEYDRAYEYMKILIDESGYIENNEIVSPNAYVFYRNMGRYALHCGKIDSARYYFDKLIGYDLKEAGYDGLLRLYQTTGPSDSIVKYSRLFASANDSSHIGKNAETVAQITAMYNYGREKNVAEKAKEQLLKEKTVSMWLLVLVFCLVMLIILGVYVVSRIRKRNVDKIVELNLEIEHKKRLLDDMLLDKTNDKRKEELEASLNDALAELKMYKTNEMLAAFFESDIYKLFKRFSVKGGNELTQDEWDEMTRLFNSTFSSYIDYIHSGKSITNDQVRVCMLIRMGFGEKEMSNIMNVDIKRITRIKGQINQKFFDSNSAKDLLKNLKPYF